MEKLREVLLGNWIVYSAGISNNAYLEGIFYLLEDAIEYICEHQDDYYIFTITEII